MRRRRSFAVQLHRARRGPDAHPARCHHGVRPPQQHRRRAMTVAASVPLVRAEGDPFSVGHRHGLARARTLRAFINDSICRLNLVMQTPVSMDALVPTLADYGAAIAAATPDLAEEIRGLAHGAGISWHQALLLQVRREIMGYRKVPAIGGCTTYARAGVGPASTSVLAQTVDLNGNLDDQISVLELAPARSRRRALVLSFAGLLGYLGLNSDGLAVGLNLVLGGEWCPGLPPYLAIRYLLDTAANVDQAVSILRGLRLASSRSVTLCDRAKSAYVELLDGQMRVVEASETVHTNHFLHPDFAPNDELNIFARNSSLRRLSACRTWLSTLRPEASVEDHFAILSAPPICVFDEGDIRRELTVAGVVMLPSRGELYLRPGNPSQTMTQVFAL